MVHLGKKTGPETISEKDKDFPYNIMTQGNNHVAPPLSRQELMGLADFIYDFLKVTNDEI